MADRRGAMIFIGVVHRGNLIEVSLGRDGVEARL